MGKRRSPFWTQKPQGLGACPGCGNHNCPYREEHARLHARDYVICLQSVGEAMAKRGMLVSHSHYMSLGQVTPGIWAPRWARDAAYLPAQPRATGTPGRRRAAPERPMSYRKRITCPVCGSVTYTRALQRQHQGSGDCKLQATRTRMKNKGFVPCEPYEKALQAAGVPVQKGPSGRAFEGARARARLLIGHWAPAWAYNYCVVLRASGRSIEEVTVLLAHGFDDPQLQAELAAAALR